MARGALQVVGHRPVVFVAELVLDDRGDQRADAAELRVAERVLACPPPPSACPARSAGLRRRRRSSSRSAHVFASTRAQERGLVERHFGEQQHAAGSALSASSARPTAAVIQPAWRPITSSTKILVDVLAIDATSNAASRIDVATYFATEPKPGQLSVIGRSLSTVFGTWIARQRIAERLRDLRHLEAGVGGVVAAVVEEVADVVRAEHLDQALVLRAALLEALELVAARAERAAPACAQRRDRARRSPGRCRSGPR